ncbi:sensor histidine kinase [Clostridium magnum]|uniref:histidine kinase n=1 Tax=Clostridium magnum DSM 2767 TaxID=1121326 RepID=A0A161YP36_9CLOT|nr:HAMP domain-containing sensor histidine kinase [Clostridium magnum]KZL92512.1 sensor histidine kinase YycG [Clostridium magnum DSM 2767]SHI22898.1 Signal transduction histidine kinase [Clostridium magnum DSM 2767]
MSILKKNKSEFHKRWHIKHRRWREMHDKKHEHLYEIHKIHQKHKNEFNLCHKYLIWLRPMALLINIFIIYLIFKVVGIKAITMFFAAIFTAKEIAHLYIYWRLEKRIMKPIESLKTGVEQIAKGNYEVRIEKEVYNEIGILIDEFNEMAERLEQGERLKKEYEENRKTLIANISHDLKTPITSINGYVEAILDGVANSPDTINSYLKTIHNNIDYINRLIDDLFLFSKLDMQKLDFKFEKVKIKPFMRDLMEEFAFVLGEKNINFSFTDRIEREVEVNIDGKRIYQTIRNIIGNAVKYGHEENLAISIELKDETDHVRINISDNGPGIAEDKLSYVFDRFYRIDTERTKDLMSTGLGLAIAKEMVEAHGGRISVWSSLSEGSTFSIELSIAI